MAHQIWYRVESFRDEGDHARLLVRYLRVLRVTPRGVWLYDDWSMGERFVLRDARKRFACPTEREAYESFIARKKRQVGILRHQAAYAENAQWCAEEAIGLARSPSFQPRGFDFGDF